MHIANTFVGRNNKRRKKEEICTLCECTKCLCARFSTLIYSTTLLSSVLSAWKYSCLLPFSLAWFLFTHSFSMSVLSSLLSSFSYPLFHRMLLLKISFKILIVTKSKHCCLSFCLFSSISCLLSFHL